MVYAWQDGCIGRSLRTTLNFTSAFPLTIRRGRAENGGQKDRTEDRECSDEILSGADGISRARAEKTGDEEDETHLDCSSADSRVGRRVERECQPVLWRM
jgi:hypothetical protein